MFAGKKVLVTGGVGFVGSHLVDKLVATGVEVTVFDNLTIGKKDNVNPEANFVPGVLEILRNHLR